MADRQLDTQKQFLLECIRLYKDLPTLWNVKSKVYYDRAQKEMGYKILLRKYREWYPKATKQDLKKKLNALRTNYRKELRRYLASVNSGSEPVHKPTLWYYKEMSFLQDLQKSTGKDAESSMDAEQNYAILLAVDEENSTESHTSSYNTQESPLHEPATDDMDSPHREPSTVKVSTHRKPAPVTVVKKHVDSDEIQTNTSYENLSENKDEYFHWALACASDLRKMERTQQVYAKKAIAEILMEGQLGLLHRHSVKVNEPQMHGHSSKSSGQFSSPPSYIQYEAEHHSQNLDKKPFVRNPLEDDP